MDITRTIQTRTCMLKDLPFGTVFMSDTEGQDNYYMVVEQSPLPTDIVFCVRLKDGKPYNISARSYVVPDYNARLTVTV